MYCCWHHSLPPTYACNQITTGLDGEPKLDFSSYDTVFACPPGTQPGLYLDEQAFHKVKCCREGVGAAR
jgi:hypothetical protein